MSRSEFHVSASTNATTIPRNASVWPTLLLASGLLFALSPVLYDWALRVGQEPAARYAIMFPVLFALGLSRDDMKQARPDGYFWLLMAGLVAVLCIGGGSTRWGRVAVPLAMIGLCRASGLASVRGACLMLWFIPLPQFIQTLAWPEPTVLWFQSGAALLSPFEMHLVMVPPSVATSDARFLLAPIDSGLSLITMLSGLAYYISWQRREPWGRTLIRISTWSLMGLPLQALASVGALLLLYLGHEEWSRLRLDHFMWPIAVVAICSLLRSPPTAVRLSPRSQPSLASM